MSIIANNLLQGDEGYNISKSLRLRASAGANLTRTPSSAGNRKTWTYSLWCKRSKIGTNNQYLLGAPLAGNTGIRFNNTDVIYISGNSGLQFELQTTSVYRDPSSWYHIVVAFDSTQATSSNRIKLYVNNLQITSFSLSTYPTLNLDGQINDALLHSIGLVNSDSSTAFDGYITDINFIDGQALTPSSFGETDPITGVWKAKKYGGTYGTNGFYLPFSDNTSTTTLGYDKSGNSNNWTTNNISLTTGTTYDSMIDVPTMSALASNYCVMNPLTADSNATFSNGNLTIASNATGEGFIPATIDFNIATTAGYYFEVTVDSNPAYCTTGFIPVSKYTSKMWTAGTYPGQSTYNPGFEIRFSDGNILQNGGSSAYGSGATAGDTWGFAVKNGKVWARNSSGWFNSGNPVTEANPAVTGQTGQWLLGYAERAGGFGAQCTFNFGAGSGFSYTPPTGFVALNTFNLPEPSIKAGNKYMDATLWIGNDTGTTRNLTNAAGFQPDLVWMKDRTAGTFNHCLYDAVRSAGNVNALYSNTTDAQGGADELTYGYLSAFNSDGFQVSAGAAAGLQRYYLVNKLNDAYVGWQWKANGAGSSNTAGSITSTVSANPTAGFSVVTYTGNGSTGTIGHGLGVAPSMIIVKSRSTAQRWTVFHTSTSNAYIYLNETFAAETGNANLRFGNNSAVVQPTSSVFTIGNSVDVNQNTTTYVAYCFAEVAGYSKALSWTGNGSTDGVFVNCGFSPAFIIMKRTDSTSDWVVIDNKRLGYNVTDVALNPNASYAENSGYATDFTSNGFKLRTTTGYMNASGGTYIGFAFAQNPFKYSLAR